MHDYYTKYLKYKSKYLSLSTQMKTQKGGSGNDNKIKVILFKADWCGHCVTFKPTWDKIIENKDFAGKFEFIKYDADKQKQMFQKYKVNAFPTIKIEDDNEVREYDGERTMEEFTAFLNNLVPIDN
jgi:thiol-disulfide isomerase/thioredoxin